MSRNAWYGCRRDTRDARDVMFRPMAIHLPTTVDLREWCPPVMDQGELGACTAHGITAALRWQLIKRGRGDAPLSRLQLYYDERVAEGTVESDAGAEIRDGIKSAGNKGVGHEPLWPYDVAKFENAPPQACYDDAVHFRALSYKRVPVDVSSLKQALATGGPVVIGLTLYDSFESDEVAKTGVVPMPDLKHEQVVGGHCMLCVGYGQKPGTFTVMNSWNTDWGDEGFCYMPEGYLGSANYGSDYWLVETI